MKLLNILRNKMKKHMFLNAFSYSSTMTSLDLFSFLLLLLSVACWIESEFNSWDGQRMPKNFKISMPGRFIHKTSTCLVGLSESDVITMIVINATTKRNLHISQSCGFYISDIPYVQHLQAPTLQVVLVKLLFSQRTPQLPSQTLCESVLLISCDRWILWQWFLSGTIHP